MAVNIAQPVVTGATQGNNPIANPTPTVNIPAPTVNQAQQGILATPQSSTASLANTVNANAASSQLNSQQGTVEGRTASILDANSPLMQRAAAKANIASNARGMRNSSMAVGAAQNAVISAAAPIANSDAAAFNQFQRDNTQNLQQTNLTNASTGNRMNAVNAGAEQQASQFNAQQDNALNVKNAELSQQASQFNAQSQNKVIYDQLDQTNKIQLGNIQAAYKNEMQANVTASNLFNSTMNALSIIQKDTTMNADTKQRNIDQMVQMLKAGMNMSGAISNLNLGATLDFTI